MARQRSTATDLQIFGGISRFLGRHNTIWVDVTCTVSCVKVTRFPYSDKISIRGKWCRARASFKGDRKSEIGYVTNLKISNYGVARRQFAYTITRVPSTHYIKDSLE